MALFLESKAYNRFKIRFIFMDDPSIFFVIFLSFTYGSFCFKPGTAGAMLHSVTFLFSLYYFSYVCGIHNFFQLSFFGT
jgi:hypothetical protein